MVDTVDKKTRSRVMASVKGADTKPERMIRSALHRRGFRYRLHDTKLPGRPDLVLRRYHAVIFVHGCFWHRHEGCRQTVTPKSNREFWKRKFAENVARDKRNLALLRKAGWRIAIIWECALKKRKLESLADAIAEWLRGSDSFLELPAPSNDLDHS